MPHRHGGTHDVPQPGVERMTPFAGHPAVVVGTRSPGAGSRWRLAGLVALGGAVGTTARAVLEAVAPAPPGSWPWTTFAINVAGSFLLGVLLESLHLSGPDEGRRRAVRLGVGTGVLGGFTTYSTFALEADRLLTGGGLAADPDAQGTATVLAGAPVGAAYALGSVVLGVAAAALGIRVTFLAARRRTRERGAA